MIFFYTLWSVTLVAWLIDATTPLNLSTWESRMRVGLVAALFLTGVDHWATPERYIPMISGFIPFSEVVVALTGGCEIAGAIGLVLPAFRRAAGLLLAIYFVAVFPANIANAVHGLNSPGLPADPLYYRIRLLFQPMAIWWALMAGEVLIWRSNAKVLSNG